jgi:hypothetical protein
MTTRTLLFSCTISLATACGGGTKPAPVEPTPSAVPVAEPMPNPEPAKVAEPAPPPAPPAPKFVLGDSSVTLQTKSKTATIDIEIKLAADGTVTATGTQTDTKKKKKKTQTTTSKLGTNGELTDDKGVVVARLTNDGTVEARQESETQHDGVTVKSEVEYKALGKLEDSGVFTKPDGKQLSFDDSGKIAGFAPEMQVTFKGPPEHKKAGLFVVLAMFGAAKHVDSFTNSAGTQPAVPATPANPKAGTPAKSATPATPAKK